MSKAWLAALLAVVGTATALRADDAKSDEGKAKVRVILIDGQNNHEWRRTTPFLKKTLEDSGRFTVDVSSNPKKGEKADHIKQTVPFLPDLSKYDVLLSNYNSTDGKPWPEKLRKQLEERLKEGKIGLVIVHAANNSFSSWDEYNQMIGLGWRGADFGKRLVLTADGKEKVVAKGQGPGSSHGPNHSFLVVVRDREHPITKGMPREWLHASDELYHGLRGPAANMSILATAYSDKKKSGTGEHEPMIWTVKYGDKGRVFHTPMGHDLTAMHCIGFITTLRRGTEWAATGKVTLPIPKDFPTADKTSSVKD
jgi:type 1 glutamine amidotransferase